MTMTEFLELMNADLQNEWTHLQFYLYHASAVTGLHAEEYKEFLTEAAKGELQHVQKFLDCLYGLGYPRPAQVGNAFNIYTRVEDILIEARRLERTVVENYAIRIEQAGTLDDIVARKYLAVFYEDHLQDSYEDAQHIQRILVNVDVRLNSSNQN